MTKTEWKEKIIQACKDAKTYKDYFDGVIDTLAQIMESRDRVHEKWVEGGCFPTINTYTDRSGKKNVHKSPLLALEIDLNSQELKYWSELGLTAAGLKRLNVKDEDNGSLEDLLKKLG